MSTKSQFLATTSGSATDPILMDSLSVAISDTRNGFDAKTQKLVDTIKAHADVNDFGDRFDKYCEKITPVEKTVVAPRTTVKFGSGM